MWDELLILGQLEESEGDFKLKLQRREIILA